MRREGAKGYCVGGRGSGGRVKRAVGDGGGVG